MDSVEKRQLRLDEAFELDPLTRHDNEQGQLSPEQCAAAQIRTNQIKKKRWLLLWESGWWLHRFGRNQSHTHHPPAHILDSRKRDQIPLRLNQRLVIIHDKSPTFGKSWTFCYAGLDDNVDQTTAYDDHSARFFAVQVALNGG